MQLCWSHWTEPACNKRQLISEISFIRILCFSPNRAQLESLQPAIGSFTQAHSGKVRGVILTIRASLAGGGVDHEGRPYDFLSRYFAPWVGIDEDPVTGKANIGP